MARSVRDGREGSLVQSWPAGKTVGCAELGREQCPGLVGLPDRILSKSNAAELLNL